MSFSIRICLLIGILIMSITELSSGSARAGESGTASYRLVIHGGAGTILKENMTPEKEQAYKAKLEEALHAGEAVLKDGGEALDAVAAAIHVMEDSPLFNAGKGAVFTHDGRNEMDASIMDGRDLNAGAVTGVTRIKHPIDLAREVMDHSRHVMLAGAGAEEFAAEQGMDFVNPDYFRTQRRWDQLQNALKKDELALDHTEEDFDVIEGVDPEDPDHKFGTVGAVALDVRGNLAAGTSTGGMTNKRYHRIGDSPIIGAGTYADNNSCGVSATGHGEFFIRATVARSICALMEYKGLSLQEAADEMIMKKLVKMGGDGGIIALDHDGNISMTFNTPGMYRGYITEQGEPVIGIYKN
jgi:beta-aspartyl-peptidase (threonine type)